MSRISGPGTRRYHADLISKSDPAGDAREIQCADYGVGGEKPGDQRQEVADGWDGGIVSYYYILDGNLNDETQWELCLTGHVERFYIPSEQATANRGLYSTDNELFATDLGSNILWFPSVATNPRRGESTRGRSGLKNLGNGMRA